MTTKLNLQLTTAEYALLADNIRTHLETLLMPRVQEGLVIRNREMMEVIDMVVERIETRGRTPTRAGWQGGQKS